MTLDQLYESRIDSTRSINYYGEFDCFCETVFFSLCDGDTGESLKTYEVSFDEETGEVDFDVEFTSEHDSGYCNFKRLPKQVREHVLAIVEAYIKEQTEENALFEESAEMEVTEEVEVNTLAQQFDRLFKYNGSNSKVKDFMGQYKVSMGVCAAGGVISHSIIFADGSVWGDSKIIGDYLGYEKEYQTEYWR